MKTKKTVKKTAKKVTKTVKRTVKVLSDTASLAMATHFVVRTRDCGTFYGTCNNNYSTTYGLTLYNARRLCYWKGAAGLSGLSRHGVLFPKECKFSPPVEVILYDVIEVLPLSEKALASLNSVKDWVVTEEYDL
jgi:hypothetical protein